MKGTGPAGATCYPPKWEQLRYSHKVHVSETGTWEPSFVICLCEAQGTEPRQAWKQGDTVPARSVMALSLILFPVLTRCRDCLWVPEHHDSDALMQECGQPVTSRAQQVDRVNRHGDTELIQFDILTSDSKLDCHLNYYPGPIQPFDWRDAYSAKRMLEGHLDFILTRQLKLY